MSIRVFISHSTWPKADVNERLKAQVTSHSNLLKTLCERLMDSQDPMIEVVVDKYIPLGRFWRDFIFNEISECHAAIVLLNEQALHFSNWVMAELTVLGCRAHIEKDSFRLIIVPFGGVTGSDIAKKKELDPIALNELQIHPKNGLNEEDPDAIEELIQKILSAFQDLKHLSDKPSSSGWLVTQLCNMLPSDLNLLHELANLFNVQTIGLNSVNLRRHIAHALYSKGTLSILDLVKHPELVPGMNRRYMLEILGTYWVEMSASVGLLSFCRSENNYSAVAINGKEVKYTPHIYIRQVCDELIPWPVIELNELYDIQQQIRVTLINDMRFSSPLKKLIRNFDIASNTEIDEALNRLMSLSYAPLVFVTFLQIGGGNVDDIIEIIYKSYPSINVIVCTGTEPKTNRLLPPEVLMLLPEIDLTQENKEFEDYLTIEMHI